MSTHMKNTHTAHKEHINVKHKQSKVHKTMRRVL